jgi:hypothetical protein
MQLDGVQRNSVLLWSLSSPPRRISRGEYWPCSSGNSIMDGMVGIVLGLFICSRPAANGIDLLFVERGAFKRVVKQRAGIAWFLLNGLVMAVGWFVNQRWCCPLHDEWCLKAESGLHFHELDSDQIWSFDHRRPHRAPRVDVLENLHAFTSEPGDGGRRSGTLSAK